ncbi:histidine phosphatase family protein [Patescibacteria group bacterium]|nr:histidine phosphatase family protein [Patescibacteria group bacterium]
MEILLVRHGETEANVKKMHQYSHESLSTEGLRQAEILAKRLINYEIGAILSSPYQRTKQTAEIIGKHLGKEVEYDDLLRELKRPSEVEGKPIQDEEVLKIKALIDEQGDDSGYRYSDEENFTDFRNRASELLTKLTQRKEDRILVITHGQVIIMLFSVMTCGDKLTAKRYQHLRASLQLNNSGITVFNYTDSKWSLRTWNDTEHL